MTIFLIQNCAFGLTASFAALCHTQVLTEVSNMGRILEEKITKTPYTLQHRFFFIKFVMLMLPRLLFHRRQASFGLETHLLLTT